MNSLILAILLTTGTQWHDKVKHPDCSGVERWATSMAYVHLKNAQLITPESLDSKRTACTRIASQQIGEDLFRQVHRITFTKVSGEVIEVITVNNASSEECSMSNVEAYVISRRLGP